MSNNNELARIRWKCRRGMLELDLLLDQFCKEKLNRLSSHELHTLQLLLEEPDVKLHAWLLGYEIPLKKYTHLINKMRSNENV